MRIALCFNRDDESTLGVYFERAFRELGCAVDHYWTRDAGGIARAYDLYVRIDHGDYADDVPEDLHPAVFYASDTHLPKPYRRIKRQVGHYELTFCAQWEGTRRLREEARVNVRWLPHACDPAVHRRVDTPLTYDVGFVGTDGKKAWRKTLLCRLRRRYPESFLGAAPHTELARIYSASRIGFNCSIRGDINMRMFEIMSCGTLLLTNILPDDGFRQLFQPGVHLVTYRTERELYRQINYYLAHEEERAWIAANGQRLAHGLHTYRHRAGTILNTVQSMLQGCYDEPRAV